jgi:hypothetical protein
MVCRIFLNRRSLGLSYLVALGIVLRGAYLVIKSALAEKPKEPSS